MPEGCTAQFDTKLSLTTIFRRECILAREAYTPYGAWPRELHEHSLLTWHDYLSYLTENYTR